MKIQHIAIIFIIIILPISMTLSSYTNSQIDTIKLQTDYTARLTGATYDAVKAFQINTVNNRYSSVSDSKIRDVEAAINTFYTSLSSTENLIKEELQDYVPALVFTLYDGYYIYSKYDNVYINIDSNGNATAVNDGQPVLDEEELKREGYASYGLKPYIYYSCRYKDSTRDFVVNYTLDNAITIYGTFNGTYVTKSGYLINPNAVTNVRNTGSPLSWKLTYNADGIMNSEDVEIEPEILTEHILFASVQADGRQEGDYTYLVYNGQKIYYDTNKVGGSNAETNYFRYQNYGKVYITDTYANTQLLTYLRERTRDNKLYSTSSLEYYIKAKEFSEEVSNLTRSITQAHAVDEQGNPITSFSVKTQGDIFVASSDNDPLISGSDFNENRMVVIRNSIETNLAATIANYNMFSGNNYEFALPILNEEEWAKITNKVSVISFLQGIPIGHKYYNNYSVITNDNNEETINKENIYIITEYQVADGSIEREYHLPGCTHLAKPGDSTNLKIVDAYSNISFLRQTVRISEGNYLYFYPQTRQSNNNIVNLTSCYECIVNSANVYLADEIIKGEIKGKDDNWNDYIQINVKNPGIQNERMRTIRQYYLRALARERYDLYQANMDGFNI